jgi:hypothetical protein
MTMPSTTTSALSQDGVTPTQASLLSQLAYLAGRYQSLHEFIGQSIISGEVDRTRIYDRAAQHLENFQLAPPEFERLLARMELVGVRNQNGMQAIAVRLADGNVVLAYAGSNENSDHFGPNAGIFFGSFGIGERPPDVLSSICQRMMMEGLSETIAREIISESIRREQSFLISADNFANEIFLRYPNSRVQCTGHSLGQAVCAVIRDRHPDRVTGIFGYNGPGIIPGVLPVDDSFIQFRVLGRKAVYRLVAAGITVILAGTANASEPVPVTIPLIRDSFMEYPVDWQGSRPFRDLLFAAWPADQVQITLQTGIPFERALKTVQSPGSGPMCLPFVSRTEERAQSLQFSRPLRRPGQVAVLHRTNGPRIARLPGLEALFADPELVAAFRKGARFGAAIDRLLSKHQPVAATMATSTTPTYEMICAGRADYLLVDQQVWHLVPACANGEKLTATIYPDAPHLDAERLACSLSTPPELLQAVNALLPEEDPAGLPPLNN